ncbi:MAG: peptide chain release factor N(5)-glutamine methyltransferase [Tepidisphaeraceae bacterium]
MSGSEAPWTIRRLLEWTGGFFARKEVDSPRLSAELLLAHVLGLARIKLYTNYERVVGPAELGAYRELVRRAGEQEPIAYLTGKAHFFNLEFEVTPEVLIPRPDTETLVENVVQLIRHQSGLESPRVLDLCTGSGCIAAAVAHHVKKAVVVATEISPAGAALARRNVERLGLVGRVTVEEGDLFEPLERLVDRQPFDLILANPPYVPTGQIATLDRNVRDFEPMAALDGGLDGLAIHRRILQQSPQRLKAGGHIFLEIAFDQGELAVQLVREHPQFVDAKVLKDHAGNDRVLTARMA